MAATPFMATPMYADNKRKLIELKIKNPKLNVKTKLLFFTTYDDARKM